MSGLDIEAIRQRAEKCEQCRDQGHDTIREWALAAVASAADVPLLLAEVERLSAEVVNERENYADVCDQFRDERAEVRKLSERLRDARAALADALQVIADLRGETT